RTCSRLNPALITQGVEGPLHNLERSPRSLLPSAALLPAPSYQAMGILAELIPGLLTA
ncbi:hypothetical protein KUCAC02_012124, partial [Chaenocephalus aceratus]